MAAPDVLRTWYPSGLRSSSGYCHMASASPLVGNRFPNLAPSCGPSTREPTSIRRYRHDRPVPAMVCHYNIIHLCPIARTVEIRSHHLMAPLDYSEVHASKQSLQTPVAVVAPLSLNLRLCVNGNAVSRSPSLTGVLCDLGTRYWASSYPHPEPCLYSGLFAFLSASSIST